jgi:hypothetical protein
MRLDPNNLMDVVPCSMITINVIAPMHQVVVVSVPPGDVATAAEVPCSVLVSECLICLVS